MKRKDFLFYLVFILTVVSLACGSQALAPTAEVVPVQPTEMPATSTSTQTPVPTPTVTPTPTPRGPLSLDTLSQMESLIRFGRGSIRDFSLKPDGSVLAVASAVGVWFYDPETLALQQTLNNPAMSITHIAWSPDGNLLAFSDNNGLVMIWDDASQTILHTLSADSSEVSALSWASDSQQLATMGEDGKLQLWDVKTWEVVKSLEGAFIGGLAWSPDGTSLAFSKYEDQNYGSTISLWQLASNEITELYTAEGWAGSPHWSADGQYLALTQIVGCGGDVGGNCEEVLLFEVTNQKTAPPTYFYDARSVAWSPGGSQLALGYSGGSSVQIFDVSQNKVIYTLSESYLDYAFTKHLLWTSDGRHLITVSDTNDISIWDTTTHEVLLKMREHALVEEAVWASGRNILGYKVQNQVHL
ncbi:MAG: PD40 domain-containing protein [Anaerolineales bacterium]|nr:PD40 domain-containing protein [Anaerolineales bacterium]